MKKAVLISCFDWYEMRLKPIRDVLSDEYEVTILTSDFSHINKARVKDRFDDCEYINVPSYTKNISLGRILSHLSFGKKIGKRIKEIQPNLIYLLLPPNNTARYCLRYKRKHSSTKYVVDIIDMWPESIPLTSFKKTILYKVWMNFRNNSLMKADLVVTECKLYQEKLRRITCGDFETLHLFKKMDENTRTYIKNILDSASTHNDSNIVRLGYLGSINSIIDIDGIGKVIRKLAMKRDVVVDVIGDGESRDRFLEELKRAGANVSYHGVVFDENKKIEILTKCDFAINMMKSSVDVGLTIKSIDYLSYGLPLINNIKGDTWELVQNEKIGINVCDNMDEGFKDFESYNAEYHKKVFDVYERLFSNEAFLTRVRAICEKIND